MSDLDKIANMALNTSSASTHTEGARPSFAKTHKGGCAMVGLPCVYVVALAVVGASFTFSAKMTICHVAKWCEPEIIYNVVSNSLVKVKLYNVAMD